MLRVKNAMLTETDHSLGRPTFFSPSCPPLCAHTQPHKTTLERYWLGIGFITQLGSSVYGMSTRVARVYSHMLRLVAQLPASDAADARARIRAAFRAKATVALEEVPSLLELAERRLAYLRMVTPRLHVGSRAAAPAAGTTSELTHIHKTRTHPLPGDPQRAHRTRPHACPHPQAAARGTL